MKERVRNIIKWHGGKYYLAKTIASMFPEHASYDETHAGALSVLFAKSGHNVIERATDRNHNLMNFWHVLRDKACYEEFCTRVHLTPFSQQTFEQAKHRLKYGVISPPDIDAAVYFFIVARMSRQGLQTYYCTPTSRTRSGMHEHISAYLGAIANLPQVHQRLQRVELLHQSAEDTIRSYNRPDRLIYCHHPDALVRREDETLIRIADLEEGERLHGGRTVIKKMQRQHSGELYKIQVQGTPWPIFVTAEHEFPVVDAWPGRQDTRHWKHIDGAWVIDYDRLRQETRLKRADELQVGDLMSVCQGGIETAWLPEIDSPTPYMKPSSFTPGNAFFELLGAYAGNGHTGVGSVLISCNRKHVERVARWADNFKAAFDVEASVRPGQPHATVTTVAIYRTNVAKLFKSMVPGNAKEKQLDPRLLTIKFEYQLAILRGWLMTDGNLEQSSRNRIKLVGTSRSERLAVQMYQLALRCGLKPSFKTRYTSAKYENNEPDTDKVPQYDVYFATEDAVTLGLLESSGKSRSSRRDFDERLLSRVRSIEKVAYEGTVYKIDVDQDDLYCSDFVLTKNCDPPYLAETRVHKSAYGEYEMSTQDHLILLELLTPTRSKPLYNSKLFNRFPGQRTYAEYESAARFDYRGMFVLSGYPNVIYDRYQQYFSWNRRDIAVVNHASSKKEKRSKPATECLWFNYDYTEVTDE